jgi:uncharacterized protein (TIGR02453 family)
MLQASTFSFLKSLKKNNNKPWFDANRSRYEEAKNDFTALAEKLLKSLAAFDPTVAHLQAKDCLFRINRDVRFSNNKDPYKTNMAFYASKKGRKAMDCAGYYLHVEPGKSFVAGGLWMPMPPELKKVRQEIDYNYADFQKLLKAKSFQKHFTDLEKSEEMVLSRPPKGYEATNPAIEYLKLKSFIASSQVGDDALTTAGAIQSISSVFSAMHPFLLFLNRALENES